MKILNAYAGIGGNRKLWGTEHEVTAIEFDVATAEVYSNYFPNDNVIVTDAHKFILDYHKDFDFIWSSPPCPTHSDIRRCGVHSGQYNALYPEMTLYQEIILLQNFAPKRTKWVIENVIPYYDPLIPATKKLHRHLYWSNFPIGNYEVDKQERRHDKITGNSTVYGFNISKSKIKNKRKALRNMVDPKLGKFILNCASGVRVKQNINQIDIFDLLEKS
ncbi:DNA cytosine methyltransferase [Tenacibaculum sp. C7A-26P2]|uniref:DNA cytosine methyltransferase n=1 Tax=Tenacibaculum sp. C7A-26P2 TaxID=3447504 RepID=UPI003F8595F9